MFKYIITAVLDGSRVNEFIVVADTLEEAFRKARIEYSDLRYNLYGVTKEEYESKHGSYYGIAGREEDL